MGKSVYELLLDYILPDPNLLVKFSVFIKEVAKTSAIIKKLK